MEDLEELEKIKTVGLIINRDKEQVITIGRQLVQLLQRQQVAAVAIGAEAEALQLPPATEAEFCAAGAIESWRPS